MGKPKELEKTILDQYRQLTNQQINQAQMQMGMPSDWANTLGMASLGIGQGIYQTQVSPIPYSMPMGSSDYGDRITFSRINEVVTIGKYQILSNIYVEPLDELRIKVATWLNN